MKLYLMRIQCESKSPFTSVVPLQIFALLKVVALSKYTSIIKNNHNYTVQIIFIYKRLSSYTWY